MLEAVARSKLRAGCLSLATNLLTVPEGPRLRFSLRSLLKVFVVVAVLLVLVPTVMKLMGSNSGHGVTVAWANYNLWTELRLPDSATDVSFGVDRYGCEAEFEISEEDFLQWARSNGWEYERIESNRKYLVGFLHLPDDPHLVKKGYTYQLRDGEGVFDADIGRANYCVSTFP